MKEKKSAVEESGKPQVHTTFMGTQSVDPLDVIRSEAGWKEIKEIRNSYESGELQQIQHLIP